MKKSQKSRSSFPREETSMASRQFSRREILKAGLGGMAMCAANFSFPAFAFPPERPDEELVSFLDMLAIGESVGLGDAA
jgi:hypothetical protein